MGQTDSRFTNYRRKVCMALRLLSFRVKPSRVEILPARPFGGKTVGHHSVGTYKLFHKRRLKDVPAWGVPAYHTQVAAAANGLQHGKKQQHTL